MSKGKNQKAKLLKILDILRRESDENHPISTKTLIDKLFEEGIECERKTLYDDIETLNECGYEIMTVKSKTNFYYIEDRDFSTAELKILLDAVEAARFITKKKTEQLSEKLAYMAGKHKAEVLKSNILTLNGKHTNERIYYNVDTINEAIDEKKQISFKYFDYDLKLKRVYRKEGESYITTPIAMLFSEDNYYLITYSDKYDRLVHYRVDKMDGVEVVDLPATKLDTKRFNLKKYGKSVFEMYSGKMKNITLRCHISLIDVIIDRFGQDVIMNKAEEDTFTVCVPVEVSPTFYSWLFTFGDKMKVLSPMDVVSEVKQRLSVISSVYK